MITQQFVSTDGAIHPDRASAEAYENQRTDPTLTEATQIFATKVTVLTDAEADILARFCTYLTHNYTTHIIKTSTAPTITTATPSI